MNRKRYDLGIFPRLLGVCIVCAIGLLLIHRVAQGLCRVALGHRMSVVNQPRGNLSAPAAPKTPKPRNQPTANPGQKSRLRSEVKMQLYFSLSRRAQFEKFSHAMESPRKKKNCNRFLYEWLCVCVCVMLAIVTCVC